MEEELVPVDKYSEGIRKLNILKRISVDYPLLCREEVARKLANVTEKLPKGIILQVDSAYRTRKTQEILHKNRRKSHPGLVFNPRKGAPPHCTGGAVDISLVDSNNKEINLSAPFEKFYKEPQLYSEKITERAQRLRLLLNKIMLDEGFAPNKREYWHFSYGDKMWADYYGKEPIYAELTFTGEYYFSFIKVLYLKILRKLWKVFNYFFKIQTNY